MASFDEGAERTRSLGGPRAWSVNMNNEPTREAERIAREVQRRWWWSRRSGSFRAGYWFGRAMALLLIAAVVGLAGLAIIALFRWLWMAAFG